MNVSDLGESSRGVKGHEPYNKLEGPQNEQQNVPFPKPGKYPNKPEGFENADLRMRSPVEKSFYAKDKLKELSQAFDGMTSFGRFHE